MTLGGDVVGDVTLLSNLIFVASEVLMLVFIVKWALSAHNGVTGNILTAWALVSSGYLLRIGFWALGVFIGNGESYYRCDMGMDDCVLKSVTYPGWALEYRGWLIIAALMVAWGTLMFIRHIEGFTMLTKTAMFCLIIFFAALPLAI